MGWKDIVGPVLQSAAPTLAKGLLGQIPFAGPLIVQFGGEMIDDAIGKLIAETLGVEATPEAVKTAIETMPTTEVVEKLKAAEAVASARWPALTEIAKAEEETARVQIVTTAESMKQEVFAATELKESKWRTAVLVMNAIWRPLYALEFLIECMCFATLLGITLVKNDQFDIDAVVKLWPLIALYMGARFGLLGYHMNLRTREKEAVTEAVTDAPKPVVMDEIKALLKASGVRIK